MTTEMVERQTSIADRCDRCGAEAFAWVNGISGDLYFCGHHFTKHESALKEYAFEVVDDRKFINAKPATAAY